MILVMTGNGKGKTTSAIGTAIRGLGWGKKVAMVHFDKGGSHYGEQHIYEILQDSFTVHRYGQQRFDEGKQTFRFENTEADKADVQKGIDKIYTLYKEKYFLIIADELISCMNLGLTDKTAVQELVDACPSSTHLILTGRNAPAWLIEKADLVSEVKDIKHYHKKNKGKAIKGLDY